MLNLGSDYMVFSFGPIKLRQTFQNCIVTFSSPRGEDYFFCVALDEGGHLSASLFYSLFSIPAKLVSTRVRISELSG